MQRRTELQWRELFAEHESSGMTAAVFCRERDLRASHFSVRRKQLLAKEANTSTPSFIPVALSGRNASMMIEFHWGDTLQLRVPTSISPRWLAEFVQHLRA